MTQDKGHCPENHESTKARKFESTNGKTIFLIPHISFVFSAFRVFVLLLVFLSSLEAVSPGRKKWGGLAEG
jgi:hypothetical protein